MRIARTVALTVAMLGVIIVGCDSGSDTYSIDGDYSLGTVEFVYGGDENPTWTLYDVLVTIDTATGEVFFSGEESDNDVWGYSGDYERSGNRIVALDLPEVREGSEDRLDLRLEFTSSRRFEGVAINWVYDRDDLTNVGAANVSGRETFISAADARQPEAIGSDRTPSLEIIDK